jgi:hypothetical protein
MIQYEFNITDRVKKPDIKNVYQVLITYMHGDGDLYTTETYNFKKELAFLEKTNHINLNTLINILEKWFEINWNIKCEMLTKKSELVKFLAEFNITNEDYVYNIFVNDSTSRYSTFAHIEKYEIFFYDENGDMFNVTASKPN